MSGSWDHLKSFIPHLQITRFLAFTRLSLLYLFPAWGPLKKEPHASAFCTCLETSAIRLLSFKLGAVITSHDVSYFSENSLQPAQLNRSCVDFCLIGPNAVFTSCNTSAWPPLLTLPSKSSLHLVRYICVFNFSVVMVQEQSSPSHYIWSYGHLLERYHSRHLHLNSLHIGPASFRNNSSLHLVRTSFYMVTFMIANILSTSLQLFQYGHVHDR